MKTKNREIFEEEEDDEDDIYEGLPNFDFDHALKKFQVKNHSLEQEVSILKKELEESIKRSEELGAENINLRKNISCLFKTAEAEIKRKERSIADLRRELDSVVFRRRQGDRNAARIKTRLSDTLRASHSQQQNTSHVKQIGGVEHSSPSAEKSSMHLAPSQHAKFLHEAEVQASTPYNDSAVTSSPTICEYQQYRHSTKPKRMYVSESEDEDDEPAPQGNVATLYSKRMKAQFLAMKSTSDVKCSPNNTQGPDALSNSSKREKSHQGVAGEKASESSGKCSSEKQASERPSEAASSSLRLGKTDNHLEKKDEVHNGSSKFARQSLFEQCVKKKFGRSVGSSHETAIRNQHQSTNEIHAQVERPRSHTGRKSKAVSPEPLHTESAIQQVERSLSRSSSSTATSQLEEIGLHTPLNRCVERPRSHTGRKSKAVSPELLHTESAIQHVERSLSRSSSSTATSQLEEIELHTPLNRCVPKEGPKLTQVEQISSFDNVVLQQEEVGSPSSESSSQQMQKTESFTSVRVQQVISLSPNDGKNMAGDTDTKVSFTVASEQCEFKRTKRRRPFTILIAKGPIMDTPSKPVSDDKVCRVATCTDDENVKPQGEVNKSPNVINKSPKVIKSDNVNSNHLPKSELKRKLDNIPLDAIVHPKKRKINWEDSEFSEGVSAENTKEVKVIGSSVVKEKENKAEVVNVTKESKDQKRAIHSDREHRNGKYRSRNEDRRGSQKSRREISRFRASDRNAIKSASYRSKSRSRSNEDRRKRNNSPSRKMWSCREKTENDGKREKLIMIIKKKSVKHSDSKYSKDKDHKKVRRELVCTAKEEPKKGASDVAQRKQSEYKREKYQNCSDKGNVLSRYANKISEQSEKSIAQTKVVTIPISPKFKNRKCNFGDDTSVTEAAKSSPSKETRLSIVAASNEVLSASNKEESSSTEEGEITSDSEND